MEISDKLAIDFRRGDSGKEDLSWKICHLTGRTVLKTVKDGKSSLGGYDGNTLFLI